WSKTRLAASGACVICSVIRFSAGLAMALALGGCAAGSCHAVTVVVADKEERSRLEMMPRGFRTGPTGQLEEVRQPVIVREYWVRPEQGAWLRVSAEQYQLAEKGRMSTVCQ